MTSLFEIDGVSVVRDGITILDRVSLSIEPGCHTAILGPNGSGKSTLIKLLVHEIYPHAGVGSVKIWGQDRWVVRDLRPLLGLVSPTPGEKILGEPTVADMAISGLLGTFGVLWGYEVTEEMRAKAHDALQKAGMINKADQRFETLSAGESRRTLIARALVSDPKGLILDEPTTSLDMKATRDFLAMMRNLASHGSTLVLVTHHLEEIVPEIERVVLLSRGRIIADGPKEEVLTLDRLAQAFELPQDEMRALIGPSWNTTR
jgi:iron complex transport system ATP-binding protein